MSVTAAVLGGALVAGGSIGGGLFSNKANRKISKKSLRFQKDLAQKGIQWRVNDARQAGIHPLYALGHSPQTGSPTLIGDSLGAGISEAGQHIGGAVSRIQGSQQKKENNLRIKLLESQLGESDARRGLLHSETARNIQSTNAMKSSAGPQLGVMQEGPTQESAPLIYQDNPGFVYEGNLNGSLFGGNRQGLNFHNQQPDLPGAGIIEKVPSGVTTHKKGNRGLVAGEHPAYKEYRLPNGLPIMLPAGDTLSEVLEETPMWMYKSIYELNKKKYGESWGDQFLDFLWSGGTTKKRQPTEKSRKRAREWLK